MKIAKKIHETQAKLTIYFAKKNILLILEIPAAEKIRITLEKITGASGKFHYVFIDTFKKR